jgi:hypothetical protein
MTEKTEDLSLKDKIAHVLEESRVVLPGTQTLLGFQFVAIYSDAFGTLPNFAKTLHLISLGFILASTIFLMTSAAYHRIAEKGEDTERFHDFASAMIVIAMLCLAIGISIDLYVAIIAVMGSQLIAFGATLVALVLFAVMWFVYPYSKRT